MKTYSVKYANQSLEVDARWDKPFWQSFEPTLVDQSHSASSLNQPETQVKAAYNDTSIYLIFQVQDPYVRALTTQTHGPVYKDSCVEFFFAPDPRKSAAYFNLEINCCGVLLAQYHTGPRQNSRYLNIEDCNKIKIASSLSGPILNEISEPLIWMVEYALPLEILTHYAEIERPAPGVTWRGNFYKCADDCSHPHWMMWAPVASPHPDFHRPEYFGLLQFC